MASQSAALAPLGVRPPTRSTLAEANERQPAARYQRLFATLYARGRAVAPGHGFRFKNPLLSLDRTTISRCLNLCPDRFLCCLPQDGVSFVTCQQINATCQVTARVAVNYLQGVTSDQSVVLRGQHSPAYPDALRRVGYRDPETGNHDVFWTTACHLAAATIAAI